MLGLCRTVPSRPLRNVSRKEAALRALVANALLALLCHLPVVSSKVVAMVQRQLDRRPAPRALVW
jgi:hypothetical protein